MKARHDRVALIALALGGGLAVTAVLETYLVFPPGSGPDRGGFSLLFLLILPTVAFAGVLIGYGLATYSSRASSRLATVMFELVCIGVVLLGPVTYGRIVAPRYFELLVIKSWTGIALAIGVAIITLQQGVSLTRQRFTTKGNSRLADSEFRNN